MRPEASRQPKIEALPGSAMRKNRGSSLAPISEQQTGEFGAIRSADPNMSNSRKLQAAAAAQKMMAPKNQASGYNGGGARQQQQARDANRYANPDIAKHRSPVIGAGKSNLQLPPLDPSGRSRPGAGSARRPDPTSNLRNVGSAIMGGVPNSARNLHSYKSGSNNGS